MVKIGRETAEYIVMKHLSQHGFSLMEVLVSLGLAALLSFGVMTYVSMDMAAVVSTVKRGEAEDIRRWLRSSFDCRQTVRMEKTICQRGGNIRGYNSAGSALSSQHGKYFGTTRVNLNCSDTGTDFAINATVSQNQNTSELLDVPIICRKCGIGTTDPQTFNFGNSPHALGQVVWQAARDCGENMPNVEIRRSSAASGGGFNWTNIGAPDTVTLDKVCDILGFDNYDSSHCLDGQRSGVYPNGKCNWHSPNNNDLQYYNGTSWVVQRGPPKYNWTWLSQITCSGLR